MPQHSIKALVKQYKRKLAMSLVAIGLLFVIADWAMVNFGYAQAPSMNGMNFSLTIALVFTIVASLSHLIEKVLMQINAKHE